MNFLTVFELACLDNHHTEDDIRSAIVIYRTGGLP